MALSDLKKKIIWIVFPNWWPSWVKTFLFSLALQISLFYIPFIIIFSLKKLTMLFPLQMSSCALKPDPSLDCNCPAKETRFAPSEKNCFWLWSLLTLSSSSSFPFKIWSLSKTWNKKKKGRREGKRKGLKKEKTKKRAHSRIWIPGSKASLPFVFREDDLRPRQGGEAGRRRWGPSPWNPVEASKKRTKQQELQFHVNCFKFWSLPSVNLQFSRTLTRNPMYRRDARTDSPV